MATHSVTHTDVALWLRLPNWPTSAEEQALMEEVLDSVAELIERDYIVAGGDPDGAFTPSEELALKMSVARLWQRRGTPEGAALFGVDGVIRVRSEDVDVERILQRRWGFA